jgi:predicted alpha/beta-hydrolase family hydrolase
MTAPLWPDGLGLIVNRAAGAGADRCLVESVLEALVARHVITGPGELGAAFIDPRRWTVGVVPVPGERGAAQTLALARAMAERGVGVIAVIGGDGTMADVASAIVDSPHAPVLCGIGAGSMSVGQLITCGRADLDRLDSRHLEAHPVPALVATSAGKSALAFNDIVLGTTLVGTLGGRLRDLDAMAYLQGERRPGRPRAIGLPGTVLRKARVPDDDHEGVLIARGRRVGGIVAGFTSPAFAGQAVTGGVCLSSWVGLPAGCVISNVPLARVELTASAVAAMAPVHSSYTSLDGEHQLVIDGVRPGTVVLADGNPLAALEESDSVAITLRPSALRVLRPARKLLQSRAMEAPAFGDRA